MLTFGMLLTLLAVSAGVVAYLVTGGVGFLIMAAVGLTAGVSGYVLTLGGRRPW